MKTYVQMSHGDFEELVRATYGRTDYKYVIECGNDFDRTYENIYKKDLDEYQLRGLEKFMTIGKYSFLDYTLIQDLVNKGLLPEGNILIQVCW